MEPLLDALGPFLGSRGNVMVLILALVKILVVLGMVMGAVPFVVLYERKLLGWIQERPGPNRVGPWGLFQGIVDGIKLFLKEDMVPATVDRVLYFLGPAIITMVALIALCIIPFGPIVTEADTLALYSWLGISSFSDLPRQIPLAITNLNISVLFIFAVTAVGVYGITLAGWSSNNKWSLLGGIRSSAQMISYEITMGLALAGVLLIAGTLNFYEILADQSGGLFGWFVWYQPIGFVLFVVAGFAETNRLPFDLPEAESELTGGYHTEYSSMKFALFFLSEYINMVIMAAVATTLFLGGYMGVIPTQAVWAGAPTWLGYLLGPVVLFIKIFGFVTLFIFVRGVLPRFRYDQLMNLGWKVLLPLGFINLGLTAVLLAFRAPKSVFFVCGLAVLIVADQVLRQRRRRQLSAKYRYFARQFSQ